MVRSTVGNAVVGGTVGVFNDGCFTVGLTVGVRVWMGVGVGVPLMGSLLGARV